jgi:hypothetical protein
MVEIYQVAIRTWKRDGSQDLMSLNAAVENLSRHERDDAGAEAERQEAVRRALLAGETLETPLARFTLQREE